MQLVSIITVNYNHKHLTEALLASISTLNAYKDIEIIVIDNGSAKNPVPIWQQLYPTINFIRSEINLGFAGGNNLGINAAKGDYIFLVNNDTEITPALIARLAETLDNHHEVGVVSPKILYWEDKQILQYAGYSPMNYVTARNRCIGLQEKDKGQYDDKTGPTAYAHGAAMMVRKTVIDHAGLMAENFFLYYEELDWIERIRKAGFKIWVNMQAIIYHKESMSVGKKSALKEYYMNRNRILFTRKNTSNLTTFLFYLYFILVVTPRNIFHYLKQKDYTFIPLIFKAIWWNFTNGVDSTKK